MPPSGAAGDAPENWGKHNCKDLREVAEGRKEGRRQAGHDKAGPPLRRQPSDSEGRRRRPVQAYIAAMPGWKRDIGRRLDAFIVGTVPDVRKTVKWNSPFYGVQDQGWFLGIHCYAKYVKVAFFRCASLSNIPPASPSKKKCATSTSTNTTSSTKLSSPPGSSKRASCPANRCEPSARDA